MSEPQIPEIETFVPRCQVCGIEVPLKRRNRRNGNSCTVEHAAILRGWKKWLIKTSVCLTCYHPSTPQEREDFKRWRRDRGMLHETAGKPPVKRVAALTEALQEAVGMLSEAAPELATVDQRETAIKKFKKLLDAPTVKRGKLAASVEAVAETPVESKIEGEG
jgi:hypothetical protein